MNITLNRGARFVVLFMLAGVVAACGIPRSGPSKNEIYSGSVLEDGDAFVVSVNDRVTRATAVVPAFGFTPEFVNASVMGSDTIQPGDTLGLSIWENVDDGLLAVQGTNATTLEEVQVDGSGFIYVPYAGRVKAAGNSPEAIRRVITEKLAGQTPDPQVLVRRLAGDGSTVSITGSVGGQGVFTIERPTRTITAMLARAGGVTIEPEIAQVTIFRGGHQAKVWFQDLYRNPSYDIALRGGDRILVEADTRSFTALGATGAQTRVVFDRQALSAVEAIAQVGGLNVNAADPTGVFVLRNEPQEIAAQVLGRTDLIGDQRMIYVLDLTQPNGLFMARDFVIRDADTVYVTEAPFTTTMKALGSTFGVLNSLNTLYSLAGN